MRVQVDLKRLDHHADLIQKELNEAKALEDALRLAADSSLDEESRLLLTRQLRLSSQIREHIDGRLGWTRNTVEKLSRAANDADWKLSDAIEIAKRSGE